MFTGGTEKDQGREMGVPVLQICIASLKYSYFFTEKQFIVQSVSCIS